MGFIQQDIEDRREPKRLRFADLALIPGVEVPDRLEDVTREWFERQRESIERKISQYHLSGHSGVEFYETRRLRQRIEQLRSFTDEVLRSRESESGSHPAIPTASTIDDSREASEAIRRSEEHVERLLAMKKREREFNEYLKSITGT